MSSLCLRKTQNTLLVKFNQTKFEGGVTNLVQNEDHIAILIAIWSYNYLKGLKYLEIVSQMFIEKILQVCTPNV